MPQEIRRYIRSTNTSLQIISLTGDMDDYSNDEKMQAIKVAVKTAERFGTHGLSMLLVQEPEPEIYF